MPFSQTILDFFTYLISNIKIFGKQLWSQHQISAFSSRFSLQWSMPHPQVAVTPLVCSLVRRSGVEGLSGRVRCLEQLLVSLLSLSFQSLSFHLTENFTPLGSHQDLPLPSKKKLRVVQILYQWYWFLIGLSEVLKFKDWLYCCIHFRFSSSAFLACFLGTHLPSSGQRGFLNSSPPQVCSTFVPVDRSSIEVKYFAN